MNLKILKDNIIYSSSSFSKTRGEELYNKGLVNSVKGKRIGEKYHIYGNINNNIGASILNTHLSIDVKTNKLNKCSCSCLDYEENSKYNSKYLCEHMIATVLRFYELAIKKSKNSLQTKNIKSNEILFNNIKSNSKKKLNVIPKIKYIDLNGDGYYQCELKITDEQNTVLINSINDFIREKDKENGYNFNSKFIYSPNNQYFSMEGELVFDFIKEYIEINKFITRDNDKLIKGRNIKILKGSIKRFLSFFDKGFIDLNYKHINKEVYILRDKIPLDLYGEFNNGEIFISYRGNKPIELDLIGEVFLYEGNIYILDKEKSKIFKEIFNQLELNGRIVLKKENLIENIEIISRVSNKITFSNSMKNFILEETKVKFNIDKIENNIVCTYNLNSLSENFNFKVFNGDILKGTLKTKKIDMFLEEFKFIKRDNYFLLTGDDNDIYELLKTGINSLKKIGDVSLSENFNEIRLLSGSNISSNIYYINGYLELNYEIGNISSNDIKEAMKALKRGDKFFKSSKNSYLDLEDLSVVSFLNLISILHDDENISKTIKIPKNKNLYIEGKINDGNLNFINGKERLKTLNKIILNDDKIQPKNLKGNLRNYQLKGFNWLIKLSKLNLGAILADDMGLGKTIQSISFLLEKEYKKTLIVTPTALIYNWEDELKKFAPSLKVGLVHGTKEKRTKVLNEFDNYDIILTTYGTIKNDFSFYKKISFDCMIIDEGQNIKNYKSQTSTYIKGINAGFKIALTGTPIENNLMELWSIFDFIMPGYLYEQEVFKKRFIINKENMEDLKLLIKPFILRRMKRDVLTELPKKIEKKFFVEMTNSQNKIYKSYIKEVKEKIKESKGENITLLSYITKLRQLCLDPSLVMDEYKEGSGKLKVAIELLKVNKEIGIKTLVFSQFTSLLKSFSKQLEGEGLKIFYIDGEVTAKKRLDLVKEFNEFKGAAVFLISLKAGGTGLNLTSASYVIHLDPWWNPAVEDQATDRAYRIGQKNSVEVVKLIAKNSIEEKIVLLQDEKRELIEDIINENNIAENNLNKIVSGELLRLFE